MLIIIVELPFYSVAAVSIFKYFIFAHSTFGALTIQSFLHPIFIVFNIGLNEGQMPRKLLVLCKLWAQLVLV